MYDTEMQRNFLSITRNLYGFWSLTYMLDRSVPSTEVVKAPWHRSKREVPWSVTSFQQLLEVGVIHEPIVCRTPYLVRVHSVSIQQILRNFPARPSQNLIKFAGNVAQTSKWKHAKFQLDILSSFWDNGLRPDPGKALFWRSVSIA